MTALMGERGTEPGAAAPERAPITARQARHALRLAVAVGVALLLTALTLWRWLPASTVTENWSLAWVGLDVATAGTALTTAVLLRGADRRAALSLAAGATLLVFDAWFDVCTSAGAAHTIAVLEAVVVELPLAALAALLSLHVLAGGPRTSWPSPGAREIGRGLLAEEPFAVVRPARPGWGDRPTVDTVAAVSDRCAVAAACAERTADRPRGDEGEVLPTPGDDDPAEDAVGGVGVATSLLVRHVGRVGARQRVLLADDDRAIRESLARALELEGFDVQVVGDGVEALAWARCGGFDVLVLDFMMPGLDGLTVCRSLCADGQHVPVLMLTARAEDADRTAGLEAGADDYLPKPFDLDEFLARLRALLRGGRGANQRRGDGPAGGAPLRIHPAARRAGRPEQELLLFWGEP